MGFQDHFPGAALDARWATLIAASGSVNVTDSKAVCSSPAVGDVAALYLDQVIDPSVSQVFRFLINKATEVSSDNCIWLISESGGPTIDTITNWFGKTIVKVELDHTAAAVRARYFDETAAATEYDGSTNSWAAPTKVALGPYASGEYLEIRLEIDGDGSRAGGAGGWRLVFISKPQTSTTWSDAQGMVHWERTPWVQWVDSRASSDLYLVFGNPTSNFAGGETHVEYVEHDDSELVHAWANARTLGGTWSIDHEVGHGAGLGPFSPDEIGSPEVLTVGGGGTWDVNNVKDQRVLDDAGNLRAYYAGADGSGFQVGAATIADPFGAWVKDAGNPLVARVTGVGSMRQQVFMPHVVKDLSEADPDKRYKMLLGAIDDDSPINWRTFYLTAPAWDGPWTWYDDGGGIDASAVLVPSGTASAYDERGYSGPVMVWHANRWYVYSATKRGDAAWDIALSLGEVGNPEPINLTPYGSNPIIQGHQQGPDVLTADLNGFNVDIADTTGYAQDDYVMVFDDVNGNDENSTRYSMSRVRKVVSSTRLELYHSLRGFTTANNAAIRRMVGWSQHPRHVRQIGAKWYLWSTPFSPLVDDLTYGAYMETVGVFEADAPEGPWTPVRMSSPLLYLDAHITGRRHSVENVALVEEPLTRTTELVDDFDDNVTDASKWDTFIDGVGGATVTETNGKVVITPALNQAGHNWASYRSVATWNLTGQRWYVQVPKAIGGSSASQIFALTPDATRNGDFELSDNWIGFLRVGSSLRAKSRVAGVTTILTSVTYNANAHRYWAVREDAGTIYWEISSDRTIWTVLASQAAPFSITALDIELRGGTEAASLNATTCEFDGFNTAPNGISIALPVLSVSAAPQNISVGAGPLTVALLALTVTADLGGALGVAIELPVITTLSVPQLPTITGGDIRVALPTVTVDSLIQELGPHLDEPLGAIEVITVLQPLVTPTNIQLDTLVATTNLINPTFRRDGDGRRRRRIFFS